ncbi:MAG: SDR family oxidoreductase [Candidatus Omnitrophica bacterium]|nr:SDR family oxidoreductase [Candidatus Omnitrophota bacterium]
MKILVTGANGFIGGHLCRVLETSGFNVVRAVRNSQEGMVAVGDVNKTTDWSNALRGVDAVVHLAARAHVMNDDVVDPLAEYRVINVDGTMNLARQAAQAGVKRFIFISSIKVNGESTQPGLPFTANDSPAPIDAYGISKWEAEQALQSITKESRMEIVIIRPPLVYGPGVGANFLRLLKLAGSGLPLPLGSIKNLRSLIYVGNLCDMISKCLTHPAASGETFLVADDQDISISMLLRMLAAAQNKKAWLLPMPESILRLAGRLTGRSAEIERLCCSLQLDISHTKQMLEWTPPFTIDEGIRETVKAYVSDPAEYAPEKGTASHAR